MLGLYSTLQGCVDLNVTQLKQQILANCRHHKAQVTALREQVLDLILAEPRVIKAYDVLAHLQNASSTTVAPPTAYRALDFWVEQGVLHKVAAVNGYIVCRHHGEHEHDEQGQCAHEPHEQAIILVCTQCHQVDEQMTQEWQQLQQGLLRTGFQLDDEHVVLTGICQQCQQQNQQ